jgi:hypothetical protein
MPLLRGKSRATIAANIREMIHAGHSKAQAVAASLRMAGVKMRNRFVSRSVASGSNASVDTVDTPVHGSASRRSTMAKRRKKARKGHRRHRMTAKRRAACLRNLKKAHAARRRRRRK